MFYSVLFIFGVITGCICTIAITKKPIEVKIVKQNLADLEFLKEQHRQMLEIEKLNNATDAELLAKTNDMLAKLKESGL